jgi:methoxymalonate biosynthesis acyl carrier protein
MKEDIAARVRRFLTMHVRRDRFEDATDVFTGGFVNSLFALQLVLFVEREFGLSVDNADLTLANFNSIDSITKYVLSKTC